MSADERTPIAPQSVQRVELLLHQLEHLPTLSSVAVRLLDLASADQVDIDEVAAVVASDPACCSKILTMCRRLTPEGQRPITTIGSAVAQLGLDTVRGAVLSVQVLEIFRDVESPGGEIPPTPGVFSRDAYWQHSLAVAVLCEALAPAAGLAGQEGEAYAAGLLHDLGLLALHVLLPATFDRACQLAERSGLTLDQACDRVIGLTVHSVGRRLAEHWRLPHLLGDVLWLHGQPAASLPQLPHRRIIELVTLADAHARSVYVAPVGHLPRGEDVIELARPLGITAADLEQATEQLPQLVRDRAALVGLTTAADSPQLLRALSRANQVLGRLHWQLHRRVREDQRRTDALQAVTRFHDAAAPGGSLVSIFSKVVRSAHEVLAAGYYAIAYQPRTAAPCQLMQFAPDGRLVHSAVAAGAAGSTAVADLADQIQLSVEALGIGTWLSEHLPATLDLPEIRLLPLRCGWGVHAILLHDARIDGTARRFQLEALSRTWAATIAAASHHSGAKRLGEQLAQSNRALIETRDALTRREKLASLGEIAAGAAHEMNNPLTVISGRGQLLAHKVTEPGLRAMAEQIVEQSHRLSEMISTLRQFAEPVEPERQPIELAQLIGREVERLAREHGDDINVVTLADEVVPAVWVDPRMIGRALRELLRNAAESEGSRDIAVHVQIDPLDGRLQVQVADDGIGLTKHALAHAFDPFFSAKSAGRQPGLGLAHARRLVEAHGGRITLENATTRGALASIWLPHWRAEESDGRKVA